MFASFPLLYRVDEFRSFKGINSSKKPGPENILGCTLKVCSYHLSVLNFRNSHCLILSSKFLEDIHCLCALPQVALPSSTQLHQKELSITCYHPN